MTTFFTTPSSHRSPRWRPLPPPVRATPARQRAASPARRRKQNTSSAGRGRARLPIRKELSAGGVVVRRVPGSWQVALLKTEHKRGQVWVLPKGHVELQAGERVSDAARREVQEEAGLRDLSVKNQLGVTRFKFQAENALVYKTVHYFLMTTQQQQLSPQADEGLLAAAWFPIDEAVKQLAYDTDQDIVRRARDRLRGETLPSRRLLRLPVRRAGSPRAKPAPGSRSRRARIHT